MQGGHLGRPLRPSFLQPESKIFQKVILLSKYIFGTNKIFKYWKNRADPRTLNDISLVIYEVFKIVDNEIMNFDSLPYIIKGNN